MWVWSDELMERVSKDGIDGRERVPLVAYAVGSEADLDELALEIVNGTGAEASGPRSVAAPVSGR